MVITTIAASVIFAAVYLMQRSKTPDLPPYTIGTVERGDLTQTIATTGVLSPLVSVEVSSQISGLLTDVEVDFNTSVKKGQVLARIDTATYEQRLQQANANLVAAQATHALNILNATRLKGLLESDLVSQQDYDQIKATLEQSQANLLTQRAAVESARTDLERCTITSPIDGIVIYKQADVGKTVVSSFSAPTLFTIAQDLTKMRILAPISEVDIWSVKPGQQVTFTVDALPGKTFNGQLTQVRNPYTPSDRQQQQQTQSNITSFDAVIEVDNKDLLLRPSLTAIVSVITGRRERTLKVPSGALSVKLPDGIKAVPVGAKPTMSLTNRTAPSAVAMVYRLPRGDRKATPQEVQVSTGINDGMATEILAGLREGDTVITGTASVWEPETRSLFH